MKENGKEFIEMVTQVLRAGSFVSVVIICAACVPLMIPLLMLLSLFGCTIVLALGFTLAGLLYLRHYGIHFQTLLSARKEDILTVKRFSVQNFASAHQHSLKNALGSDGIDIVSGGKSSIRSTTICENRKRVDLHSRQAKAKAWHIRSNTECRGRENSLPEATAGINKSKAKGEQSVQSWRNEGDRSTVHFNGVIIQEDRRATVVAYNECEFDRTEVTRTTYPKAPASDRLQNWNEYDSVGRDWEERSPLHRDSNIPNDCLQSISRSDCQDESRDNVERDGIWLKYNPNVKSKQIQSSNYDQSCTKESNEKVVDTRDGRTGTISFTEREEELFGCKGGTRRELNVEREARDVVSRIIGDRGSTPETSDKDVEDGSPSFTGRREARRESQVKSSNVQLCQKQHDDDCLGVGDETLFGKLCESSTTNNEGESCDGAFTPKSYTEETGSNGSVNVPGDSLFSWATVKVMPDETSRSGQDTGSQSERDSGSQSERDSGSQSELDLGSITDVPSKLGPLTGRIISAFLKNSKGTLSPLTRSALFGSEDAPNSKTGHSVGVSSTHDRWMGASDAYLNGPDDILAEGSGSVYSATDTTTSGAPVSPLSSEALEAADHDDEDQLVQFTRLLHFWRKMEGDDTPSRREFH